MLVIVVLTVAGGPRAGLGFVLVLPAVFGVRLLRADQRLDAALCGVLLAAQAGAAAGLTERVAWWDAAAHAVTAALLTAVVVGVMPSPSLARAVLGVLLLSVGWEAAELASDTFFGTRFVPGVSDTLSDLIFDMAGALAGAAGVAIHAHVRGTPRIPPTARSRGTT